MCIPAGIWCQNDVVSTSMRRHHVASTLIRRHFGTKCPWVCVCVCVCVCYFNQKRTMVATWQFIAAIHLGEKWKFAFIAVSVHLFEQKVRCGR